MTTPLLQVSGVRKRYFSRAGLFARPVAVQAVAGVSFEIARGETLGLVGESGCGKSTMGRLALALEPPDAGEVRFNGAATAGLAPVHWREMRRKMQLVFQDPLAALDRRLSAGAQIAEPLEIHRIGDRATRAARVEELLRSVGLSADHGGRFPHELSGGQRQRVIIARALASGPEILVCDEPVAALDVSIQAQVVNLLADLQEKLGLAMLFISHDLKVVRQISHRVAVMYLGEIVESNTSERLFAAPRHPYTQALIAASPSPRRRARPAIILEGEPPNPAARPSGCAFHPRCPLVTPRCRVEAPVLRQVGEGNSMACHLDAPELTGAQAA